MENPPAILAIQNFQNQDEKKLTHEDLQSIEMVINLFDSCQILLSLIYPEGWQFLFKHYGLKGIIEIDQQSQWLDDEDLGEWISNVYYQSLVSGFDPVNNKFGHYDDNTGIFMDSNNHKTEIDWKYIYNLKNTF